VTAPASRSTGPTDPLTAMVPGFGHAELVAPNSPGPPLGQHTVSKFVLKQFANGDGTVAAYERATGRWRRHSFGARIFETTFDGHDPHRSEALWQGVETRAGLVLEHLNDRTVLEDATAVHTVRELMAVHWARSRGLMTAREIVTDRVVEESKLNLLQTKPHLLADAYLAEVGLVPTTQDQLEWISNIVHDRVAAAGKEQWHSDRNPENLDQAITMFARSELQVGYPPAGAQLVIGDSPVLLTRQGQPGVGPHQGIAIGDADHIAMPITPSILVSLGTQPAIVDLTPDVVAWYNQRQWDGYQDWIVCCPGDAEETRMRAEQELEQLRRAGRFP